MGPHEWRARQRAGSDRRAGAAGRYGCCRPHGPDRRDTTRPARKSGSVTSRASSASSERACTTAAREPRHAADAFYWAAQLDPAWAEPLYARYVALLMSDTRRLVLYMEGDRRTRGRPDGEGRWHDGVLPRQAREGERIEEMSVRFRTVGDITCTCPVASVAANAADVVTETLTVEVSERGATRMDDKTSDASMEKRKKDGYF